MPISRRTGAVAAAIVLAITVAGDAFGVPPQRVGQIRLTADAGVRPADEQVASGGAVIDTYVSRSGTVKVIGRPGSSVSIQESLDAGTGRWTAALRFAATRPKTASDADAYRRSGRSTVGDLVALGMPRAQAEREFGDMDVLAAGRSGASIDGRQIASLSAAPPRTQLAPAVSATTPYDTLCASISYDSGKITGYGCSTLYLVAASGGDWWFDNKYKFSVHSTDTSIWRPQRLFEVGWGLSWAANNVVYDWEPEATINRNDCGSLRLSILAKGATVMVEAPVCPSRLSPWNLASTKSGSMWSGIEKGQAYEAAIGVQAVHSPPNAPASYESPFMLTWGPFPP
jgi:hypothetical protein